MYVITNNQTLNKLKGSRRKGKSPSDYVGHVECPNCIGCCVQGARPNERVLPFQFNDNPSHLIDNSVSSSPPQPPSPPPPPSTSAAPFGLSRCKQRRPIVLFCLLVFWNLRVLFAIFWLTPINLTLIFV